MLAQGMFLRILPFYQWPLRCRKIALHQLKKRIRYYERLFYLTDSEMHGMMGVESRAAAQKWRIKAMREHKKSLKDNIL